MKEVYDLAEAYAQYKEYRLPEGDPNWKFQYNYRRDDIKYDAFLSGAEAMAKIKNAEHEEFKRKLRAKMDKLEDNVAILTAEIMKYQFTETPTTERDE